MTHLSFSQENNSIIIIIIIWLLSAVWTRRRKENTVQTQRMKCVKLYYFFMIARNTVGSFNTLTYLTATHTHMWWLTELKHNSFCFSGDKNREIFSQKHLLPLCDVWESERWKQNLNWKIKLTTSKDLFRFLGDFDVSSLDYFSLCPDFQFQLPVSVLAWRGASEGRRVGGSEGRWRVICIPAY